MELKNDDGLFGEVCWLLVEAALAKKDEFVVAFDLKHRTIVLNFCIKRNAFGT